MNKHFFKVIFSKKRGDFVVVAENSDAPLSTSRKSRIKSIKCALLNPVKLVCAGLALNALAASMVWAMPATNALPTGGTVVYGSASISQAGNTMTINQSSQKAITNWQSFDIGASANVQVQQPNTSSVLLSRVVGSSPSQIFGKLDANGQVILINPNGVLFGKDGSVNANSFVASTLSMSDQDFIDGNYRYYRNGSNGIVDNQGKIHVAEGGYVALLGASVNNSGEIVAPKGTVGMLAGESVKVPMSTSGKITFELTPSSINSTVSNSKDAVIVAQDGQVYMKAASLNNVLASIMQSGKIDVSGTEGGQVELLADGGQIKVDGTILANAETGTNGKIIIGRDQNTGVLASSTDVSGAALEANKGFIETSADWLKTTGVRVAAREWLLDPNDIVIGDLNSTTNGSLANAQLANGISYINVNDLITALNSGNVTITTTNGTGGNGDITVNSAITTVPGTNSNILTLTANRDITVNDILGNYRTNLNAGRDVTLNAQMNGQDGFTIRAGRDINVNENFNGGTWSSLWSAQTATDNSLAWRDKIGTVNLAAGKTISYNNGLDIRSGLKYISNAGVDTSTGLRADFDGAQLSFPATNNSTTANLTLSGFANVSLPSTALNMPNGSVSVTAQNISLGGDITTKNIALEAAAFNQAAGTTLGQYLVASGQGSGWTNQAGGINFGANKLTYTGNLLLRSGLSANNTGIRQNLGPSQINWNAAGTGAITVQGFDTVDLGAIGATSMDVVAKQINVPANLNLSGGLSLIAAAFDPSNTVKGSIAGSVTNYTGWKNLFGQVAIDPAAKLTATSFNLRSGVDNTGLGRADLIGDNTLVAAAAGVNTIYLAGFDDVKLPSTINNLNGNANYTVIAHNIDATSLQNNTLNVRSLRLDAGRFKTQTDTGTAIDTYALSDEYVANNNIAYKAPDSVGTVKFAPGLTLQANNIDITSGVDTSLTGSRANVSFAAIHPYNVTDINNVAAYTPSRGFYSLSLQGFNTVDLPKHVLKQEIVDISANTINVYADINTGGGSWWPRPYYLYLKAGSYNPVTGVTGGTNAGKIHFDNPDIVLRTNAVPQTGEYGYPVSSNYGFNSQLTVINGADAADFNVKLGFKKPDYSAYTAGDADGVYSSLTINGFNNTNVQLENPNGKIWTHMDGASPSAANTININQKSTATGLITIKNDLKADQQITLDAGNGGIRMGTHVAKSPTMVVSTGANSAVNTDTDNLSLASKGGTLVINEANNINITGTGNAADAGSLELNARGQLVLANNLIRNNPNSSVTLRSDAEYGKQIATDSTDFTTQDLNSTFQNYNNSTAGEQGGDGLGAVVVNSAQATVMTPVFRTLMVVESATGFTVNAANTYYKADGTAYAVGTVIPQKTAVLVNRGATVSTSLDYVTDNGTTYRYQAKVNQGGFTVPAEANYSYYNSTTGQVYSPGTTISAGTVVYYKPQVTLSSALTQIIEPGAVTTVGGAPLYAINGYTTSNTSNVPSYTSLGLNGTAVYSPLNVSLASTGFLLNGDTPVDTSVVANYYGNPVSGTNNTLNMSGQFYTITLNGGQTAPTMFNSLATVTADSPNASTSGNGWDLSAGTAVISTNGGDLRIFSGPSHAMAGPGYAIGDASDLNIYTNPITNDFTATKAAKTGAFSLSSGTGNLVALGFRDVSIDPNGTLSSAGNVTIGASRDMAFSNDVKLGGTGKLVTLLAGGMLTTRQADGSYTTIQDNGGSNLMLIAGGGVDIQTDITRIAGSLQDNPDMQGSLANGRAPTGTFNVKALNNLSVGGTFTNTEVNDVTFSGTSGILYAADTPLQRSGITTQPIASGTGDVSSYGNVSISTAAGKNITVDQAIDTSLTAGSIQLTADNIVQNADIKSSTSATSGDITLTATTGSISRSNGTVTGDDVVLSAKSTIGTATDYVHTDANTLKLVSDDDQYISEANSVTLAASTLGDLTVIGTGTNSDDTLTIGAASGLSGIDTGSGEINIRATQNVAINADITTTANAFVEANQGNITANGATINADQLVLTAVGTMGTAAQTIQTNVNTLGVNVGADAYITEVDSLKVSGQSLAGAAGSLNIQNTSGILTAGTIANISPVVSTTNAQGYNLSDSSSNSMLLTGGLSLNSLNDGLVVADDISAQGAVMLTGNTADNTAAITLADDVVISNHASNNQGTQLHALQGDIVAGSNTAIQQTGSTGGAIRLLAGMSSAEASGTIYGTNLALDQSGAGGISVTTGGVGHVITPKINNALSGDVVVGAGVLKPAGDGSGGQVLTVAGNTITQNGLGKTYIFSGDPSKTGALSKLDSSFNTLYYQGVSNPLNTTFNAAYNPFNYANQLVAPQGGSVANQQVLFRSAIAPSFTLSVPATNLTKVYGQVDPSLSTVLTAIQDAYTAASGAQTLTTTVTGIDGSNTFGFDSTEAISSLDGSRAAGENVADGPYAYTLSGLNTVVSGTPTLSITKANLTLSGSRVYDGTTTFAGQYLTATGVNGETFSITGLGDISNLLSKDVALNQNVALNSVTGLAISTSSNGGLASNYNDLSSLGSNVTLYRADATVNGTATTATYNGTTQLQATASSTGFITGDDIVVSGEASGRNAGSYTSNLTVSGTDLDNYNVTVNNADLTIDKAALMLIGNSSTTTYNSQTQSVSGYTAVGLQGTDSTADLVNVSASGASGRNAGIYINTVTADTQANYDVTVEDGTLQIDKAALTLIGNSSTTTYNGQTQSVSGYTAVGLQGTDSTADLINVSASGASGRNAGVYINTVTADTQANYDVTVEDGTLQIDKAAATVNGTATTVTYNATTQLQAAASSTGFIAGDDIVVSGEASGRNAGRYTSNLTVSGTDADNYDISVNNADLTIDKAAATVNGTATTVTYNGQVQVQKKPSLSGFIAGDQIEITGLATGKELGTYTSNLAVSGVDAANYNVTILNNDLTINSQDKPPYPYPDDDNLVTKNTTCTPSRSKLSFYFGTGDSNRDAQLLARQTVAYNLYPRLGADNCSCEHEDMSDLQVCNVTPDLKMEKELNSLVFLNMQREEK